MSPKNDALAQATARLAAAGIESARLDARILLALAMEVAPENLLGLAEPSADQYALFETFLSRRESREPLAYITGHKEFWSLDFEVGPGVLIPRPETETLIEEALREFPDQNAALGVADLGTGSGCLLAAFLASFPNARGLGIDRSADALAWARKNVAHHGLEDRCVLSHLDWEQGIAGRFDVVFSNPPYLSTSELAAAAFEILQHEPRGALEGGALGAEPYAMLALLAASLLKPGGRVILEIGSSQADSVQTVLNRNGLDVLRVVSDLAGHPRCVVAGPVSTAIEARSQKTVGKPMASG